MQLNPPHRMCKVVFLPPAHIYALTGITMSACPSRDYLRVLPTMRVSSSPLRKIIKGRYFSNYNVPLFCISKYISLQSPSRTNYIKLDSVIAFSNKSETIQNNSNMEIECLQSEEGSIYSPSLKGI